MARKKDKNQLERHFFWDSLVVLVILVFIFLLFSNLDFFWDKMTKRKEIQHVNTYTTLTDIERRKFLSPKEPVVYFWGDSGDDVLIKRQMKNMKEKYVEVEKLRECAKAKILFVSKDTYSVEEINYLRRLSDRGVIICMAGLPSADSLEKAYIRDFLGIDKCGTATEKSGYRLGNKLLFGSVYESEVNFETVDLSLKQRTEVYVSALEKDAEIENHDLTPLFWRYKESSGQNNVYVINEFLLQQETGYAVVSFLMADIYGTYMYPVVNAYCFAIEGMPYTTNYKSDYLSKQYGKDAFGVENDILFPQINRCEDRYGLFTTWYSRDVDSLENVNNILLEYYLDDIERSAGVIGSYDDKGCHLDMDYDNRLAEWTTDFSWKERGVVQVPHDEMNMDEYQTTIMEDMCEVKGTGFHCVSVNTEAFLDPESDISWIEYVDNLETVLGTEKQKLYWIDRMTVEDAVYRIKIHELIEPVFTYEENKVSVDILNFPGEAFFYLYTDKEVTGTVNCEFLKIDDGIYFISAKSKKIEVHLKE